MFSINFGRFAGMVTKKAITGSSMLAMLLAFANVNAQTTYTFNDENFLTPPNPPVTECTGDACGGEIFLRMGTPVIEGGKASIGIWLRVESALGDTVPYLGNYLFHVATGGPGITLDSQECSFGVAEDVPFAYDPPGLAVGSNDPRSITITQAAPASTRDPSDRTHYTLSASDFVQFGTFSCPVADANSGYAYVLAPSNVFGFTIQAGAGDQRQLLLRADNSFRYFPLNGDDPFVVAGMASSGDGEVTLQITNNLTGVPSTITSFAFSGENGLCGGTSIDGAVEGTRLDDGVNDLTLTFSPALSDTSCSVAYTIMLPDGSTQVIEQTIFEANAPIFAFDGNFTNEPGENESQVITFVITSDLGNTLSADNIAITYKGCEAGGQEPVSQITPDGMNASVMVTFSESQSAVACDINFTATNPSALADRNGDPAKNLTGSVRVGTLEPDDARAAYINEGLENYRSFLETSIPPLVTGDFAVTPDFPNSYSFDFASTQLEMIAAAPTDEDIRSGRVALDVLRGEQVQALLNDEVAKDAGMRSKAFQYEREAADLTMNTYRLSGPISGVTVSGQLVRFVIDLTSTPASMGILTTDTRLLIQRREGLRWERFGLDGSGDDIGFDRGRNFDGVSYSYTRSGVGGSCPDATSEDWKEEFQTDPYDPNKIIARLIAAGGDNPPVSCLRLTVSNYHPELPGVDPEIILGEYDLESDLEIVTVAIAAVRANDLPPPCDESIVEGSLRNYTTCLNEFVSAAIYDIPVSPIDGKVSAGVFAEDVLRALADEPRTKFECPVPLTCEQVQDRLNNAAIGAVGRDAYEPMQTSPTLLMNAFSFARPVAGYSDAGQQVNFVIDLEKDVTAGYRKTTAGVVLSMGRLTMDTRLVIRDMDKNWVGFDHGTDAPDGSVSYMTGSQCIEKDQFANQIWIQADDGLIPASVTTPVSCIRIAIVNDGSYDEEHDDLNRDGNEVFVAITAVGENTGNIPGAHNPTDPAAALAMAREEYVVSSSGNYGEYLSGLNGPVSAGSVVLSPGIAVKDALTVAAADLTLEQLRAVEGGALSGQAVQDLLNKNAIEALIKASGGLTPTLLMSAYSFSGNVTDMDTTQISFVIDLEKDAIANGSLSTAARLVKQLKSGDWRGVVNDDMAGSVSYVATGGGVQGSCAEDSSWTPTEDDGVIPGPIASTGPGSGSSVNCIMITIVDGGMYDADGTAIGENRVGFISDPVSAVSSGFEVPLPTVCLEGYTMSDTGCVRSGGGGGGGSAGVLTILAVLSILGLSMWRRRSRVAVRSEL